MQRKVLRAEAFELNNLTQDLNLTKSTQLLESRLSECNFQATRTTYFWYRDNDERFKKYFRYDKKTFLVYGQDVLALEIVYVSAEWQLFLNSSIKCLKVALLHISNKIGFVPVGHSVKLTKCHENITFTFESLQYSQHDWKTKFSGDLKIIPIILWLQSVFLGLKQPFCCVCGTRELTNAITRRLAW